MRLDIEIRTNFSEARSKILEKFQGEVVEIEMKDGHEYQGHWIHIVDKPRGVIGLKNIHSRGIVYERVMDIKKIRIH